MKRMGLLGALLLAAWPVLAGASTLAKDPRGGLALDALPPGALAGKVHAAPESGDPRLWYFVVMKRPDPGFDAIGATEVSSWKNRRLVRVPPQAVEGLSKHPSVLYMQLLVEPGSSGHAAPESGAAAAGSLTESLQSHGELAGPWTTGDYSYDGAGNIRSIGPDSWARTQNYAYDGVGRLVSGTAHTRLATHTESYAFDVYGNMISRTTDGQLHSQAVCPAEPQPCTTTNRLAGPSYSYDEAGNLIQNGSAEYFWDGGGMLKEMWYGMAGQNGYVYTPDDERLGVMNNGAYYWTWTVRDFSGRVIREYESSGDPYDTFSPWLWVEDYGHGAGRLLGSEREGTEGGRRHYHTDHLGTTRLATTDDGIPGVTAGDGYRISEHVYFPIGVESTRVPQEHEIGFNRETRPKYTGHERDYLGGELVDNTNYLDYMHARYYNPNLGRFLSVDPGKDWDVKQPQSWNLYSYTRNNPISNTDPNGKYCIPCIPWIAKGLVAGFTLAAGTTAYLQMPSIAVPGKTNGEVISDDIASIPGRVKTAITTLSQTPIAAGSNDLGIMGPITLDGFGPTAIDTMPIQSSGTDRQKGERAKAGTAAEADQQLEEIEQQQNRTRTGKSDGIIENIDKSKQRSDQKRRRIRDLKDAEDEYGD